MNAEALLKPTLENAREKNRAEADYINPDDGLLYCGHCHTPKEAYFPEKFRAAGFITHPLECECAAAKSRKEEAERKEYERRERIKKLRQRAFGDNSLAVGWRFEKTEIMTEALEKVKAYVDAWDKMREQQIGLLLLGNVGTGKTHAAACAANALINRQISVRFLHTTDLVQQMKGLHREDLEEFLDHLMRPQLLVLDDLGTQRRTDFGMECIFHVVNRRELSGKPMIVTTNLSLPAMRDAADLTERRIYDRVLMSCMPVLFEGENFRERAAAEKIKKAAALLELDQL